MNWYIKRILQYTESILVQNCCLFSKLLCMLYVAENVYHIHIFLVFIIFLLTLMVFLERYRDRIYYSENLCFDKGQFFDKVVLGNRLSLLKVFWGRWGGESYFSVTWFGVFTVLDYKWNGIFLIELVLLVGRIILCLQTAFLYNCIF